MKKLWEEILVALGFFSPCCHAMTYEPVGWNRVYCSQCNKRIGY